MFKINLLKIFIFISFFSCGNNYKNINQKNNLFTYNLDKKSSIELNKIWVKDEIFKIDQYCIRQGWDMLISETGMRYKIISSENSNIIISDRKEVTMSYDIRLMDSKQTKCYHSDSNGLAKFRVNLSLIETGINEVVSYLKKGDSALVILPHHIAHGLSGDSKKIPPLSTVLYFIKIIDVN